MYIQYSPVYTSSVKNPPVVWLPIFAHRYLPGFVGMSGEGVGGELTCLRQLRSSNRRLYEGVELRPLHCLKILQKINLPALLRGDVS